jgi:hypothetical protein
VARPLPLLVLLAAAAGLGSGACRIAPRLEVAGEVVWSEASPTAGPGSLEDLKVNAGDIVRFDTTVPVAAAEVVRSEEGESVVWQTLVPDRGVALLRAGLFTSAVRASREAFRGVHTGEARKPEFGWFELESDAVRWADSPLGTPFPPLAVAERFDPAVFTELDLALGTAFPGAVDPDVTRDVIHAIRTMAALRAVHALEGLRGFPYALNRDIDIKTTGTRRLIDHRYYVLAEPGHSVPVHASGPTELFVWARIAHGRTDAEIEVRVTEEGRLRAVTRGLVRREVDRDATAGDELSQLRHVLIHVPPGEHDYAIETAKAPAFVSAEISLPASRLENMLSSTWHEGPLLDHAERSCRGSSFGPACALALALAGQENKPEYARALALLNDMQRRVAERLSQGGPGDFAATVESRAMTGDVSAETLLATQAAETVDQGFHDSWKRTTLRATYWEPVPSALSGAIAGAEPHRVEDVESPQWLTYEPTRNGGPACTEAGGLGSGREISSSKMTLRAMPWRRAHAIALVAIAPCDAEPIRLEVDGQTLVAQPAAPRALWHIVVRGETAEVRRLDPGSGHVYSAGNDACGTKMEATAAPARLDTPRAFTFPKDTVAAGLEVWGLAGNGDQTVTVRSPDGRETLRVEVRSKDGLRGLDPAGSTWARGPRVPLPVWAKDGIVVEGKATAAARAIMRRERGAVPTSEATDLPFAVAPDEAQILELSRQIAAAKEPRVRATLLEKRAQLLASFGAQVAALDDAEAAVALVGASAKGEDLVDTVRRAVRPMAPKTGELLVPAYGLEPDFDAHAQRCKPDAHGPRAEIARLEAAVRDPEETVFDQDLAVRAVRSIAAAPGDPRANSLEHLALRSSKWRLAHDVSGGAGRVARPIVSTRDRIFDPEGRLRANLAAGRPLGEDVVTVTSEAPANARLAADGRKVRLDVVCVARDFAKPPGSCPVTYAVGSGAPQTLSLALGEVTPIELSPSVGRPVLALSLPESESDYAALVRVVFDRETEGTAKVADVGWVLETPHTQHRTLVTPGHPARVEVSGPEVIRIDARAEGNGATVVATAEGREIPVPTDGEPVLIAVSTTGSVMIAARSGEATLAVARRVAGDANRAPTRSARGPSRSSQGPGAITIDFSGGGWKSAALGSPPPLSWAADRLGTFEADTGVTLETLRAGATTSSGTGVDSYFYEQISYQRRIEAPNLYTVVDGIVRLRNGPPTYAAGAGFYEDWDRYRLRITGTATGYTQEVQGNRAYTLEAQGFVEYSGRIRPDFFILPRLGYDGNYESLGAPPATTVNVDDDVFDPFRYQRRTLVFAQALFWYCPHFNDIYYLRLRGDFDATSGTFSHASVLLPGVLLIFHQAELSLFADFEYFAATPDLRPTAGIDTTVGEQFIWHAVVLPGSFELRPTISSQLRIDNPSWQVSFGINILASARRGQRDYSSLELSFPEETSGGIPWRDESRVGP